MAELEREDDADDPRFLLGGDPIHAGDVLEVELADGHWAHARFEWAHRDDGEPFGYFLLALAGARDATLYLPSGTSARWPEA